MDAPVVIAVIETPRQAVMEKLLKNRGLSEEEIQRQRPDTSLLSIGAAIENLSLAAHALGYGSCWMCAPLYAYREMEEILNVDSENKLVSLVCLGIPETDREPTLKKDLGEILTIIE